MSDGRHLTWQWRATSVKWSVISFARPRRSTRPKLSGAIFSRFQQRTGPAIVVKIDEPFAR